MLLSTKALVISERCYQKDEAEFEGMASFVPFANISQEYSRLRALSVVERKELAEARAARFAARFAPRRVYEEAGVHQLMQQLQHQLSVGQNALTARTSRSPI